MMKIICAVLVYSLLLVCAPLSRAQQCKQLDSATPDEWLSYLTQMRGDQNTECVCFVLREFGRMPWEPAADTLVKFLDFRCLDARETVSSPLRLGYPYPAADALAILGRRALPKVLTVMESGSASELARHNAMVVWMRVYRDDSPNGVAMLAKELEKAPTDTAKQRLREAVADAVKYCTPDDKAKCKAASEPAKETAQ